MTFGPLPTASQDRPRGLGYGARLGDLWLRLAVSDDEPLRTYTQDSIAQRQADQSNVYENVLDIGFDFARFDLSGGEGLDYFPRPLREDQRPGDAIRYFDSYNIDTSRHRPGDATSIKLSHITEQWWDSAEAAGDLRFLAASNTHLYATGGTEIHRFDSWSDSVPDTSTDFTPQIVESLAIDSADNGILLLDNGAVYKKEVGSATWTVLVNTASALDDAYRLWIVKSRVIMAKAPTNGVYSLGELTWDPGTLATTYAEFDTFKADVFSVIDADTAILAVTGDGKIRSYVPQADAAGDVPAITLRGISDIPGTEIPYAIGHSLGRVLVLTAVRSASDASTTHDIRAYSGVVLDERFDFIVGELELLKEWIGAAETAYEGTLNHQQPQVVSDRDTFYWLIREGVTDTTETNIWRQDVVTKGISRYINDPVPITDLRANSLVIWKNRLAWTWLTDATVRRVADNYQASGWLISPNINFGLNTEINWVANTLHAIDVANTGDAQIELWVSTDPTAINDWEHVSWTLVERINNQFEGGIENPLLEVSGATLAYQVRMYPNQSGAGTPQLTRTAIRGLPAHRDFIVEIPISVSDSIEVPGRRRQLISGYGNEVHKALLAMQGGHYELQVMQPPLNMRGVIDAILEPVPYISDRGSVGKVMMVRFRGNYVPAGQQSFITGSETMGLGLLGVAILGIGQPGVT